MMPKYEPHAGGQVEFHQSKARFKFLNCGARWGKDTASLNEFTVEFGERLDLTLDREPGELPKVRGLLLTASYPLARQLWHHLKRVLPMEWTVDVRDDSMTITTLGGGWIEVAAADDPDFSLEGKRYDIVVLSEAARMANLSSLWIDILVSVGSEGLLIANSTPKMGSFWNRYVVHLGIEGSPFYSHRCKTFIHPTTDNPLINREEIERLRKVFSGAQFREEFMAEILEEVMLDDCAKCGDVRS